MNGRPRGSSRATGASCREHSVPSVSVPQPGALQAPIMSVFDASTSVLPSSAGSPWQSLEWMPQAFVVDTSTSFAHHAIEGA
jgi:hypothetical protein